MISFVVEGAAVPQARPRFTRFGHAYDTKKCKDYKQLVAIRAKEAMIGRTPLDGPVAVVIECIFEPPESWPKHRKEAAVHGGWHLVKPDLDNLFKILTDSCNGICYEDDKQIAISLGMKRYGSQPEARVTIYSLKDLYNPRWMMGQLKKELGKAEI